MARTYFLLLWTWTRAAAAYPVSFAMMTVLGFAIAAIDVAVILIIFANTTTLAGFSREEVLFLYGAANLAFTICDTFVSNLDRVSTHIKAGTLDTFLIRPVGAWIQLAADRFMATRIGRILQAGLVLGYAVSALGIGWERAWMIPVMVLTGIVIFASLWTIAGALQFLLTDAPEVVNTLTYGGSQLTQYPFSVYTRDLVKGVTYVLPLAFVNWQPGLYVLDRADPFGTPGFMRFLGPAAALVLALSAALVWRQGLRHYRSTGS
ncbi:integral membrane transport protein [[Actinomadura] parvosata subsp. kistnae]|uniref:Transporter n=1 Tax=[Actinomadura] parvosata subsp. kistnae TaxID=1909395 RepID=A0A1V0A2J3_9ACTN|nr:ABC-2 family transporter protein [Nonomuraea sp. ATCC 55076]AQZ64425.1 transporter [Nonomuraea sp. ATCC 55076]SPL89219.1 integral membrane transport protein [Actinomadura parvosata subsp. kistnae]